MYKDDGLYCTMPSVSSIRSKMEPIGKRADGRQDERTSQAGFQFENHIPLRTV